MSRENAWNGLQEKVAFLGRPESYPERARRVDVIETHMSWVFLIDRYVYKLKKPVRFRLLKLATLEERRLNCHAEVRLNRRLAPDVYLGVVPLGRDETGALTLGVEKNVADWLVKMRRLPARRMLDRIIDRGEVEREDIRRLARTLAAFYRRAASVEIQPQDYRGRFEEDIDGIRRELQELSAMDEARIKAVSAALIGFVERRSATLDRRLRDGKIVEGHGDLRPEHVCLLAEPVVIDCVEFSRRLRILDPAEELSFLTVECARLGAPPFVERILFESYSRASGDEPPRELIRFYKAYRAFFRAQSAIWHLHDPNVKDADRWSNSAERYVEIAERLIAESPELLAHPSRSSTTEPLP